VLFITSYYKIKMPNLQLHPYLKKRNKGGRSPH